MGVYNPEKARTKSIFLNDVKDVTTQLMNESNKIQETIAQINYAVGGTPSGLDRKLINDCQAALAAISETLSIVNTAGSIGEKLSVYD